MADARALEQAITDGKQTRYIRRILDRVPAIDSNLLNVALQHLREVGIPIEGDDADIVNWVVEVLHLLLNKGADPNRIKSLYHLSLILDMPLLMKCVNNHMNLDLQDEYGNTLIIHLLYRTRVYREDFRVINQQYGVEGINDFSHTAKVIEYLLDHEVELSLQNQQGQIAAHYIPYLFFNDPDMHVNIIRIIQLSPQTKKHAQNENDIEGGRTPLMEFANIPQELIGLSDNTMIEIAQLFLDAGANPMERNDQGHTASEVAFEQDNNALGQFLQQKEREYQHEAQGALVSRMRGREGANRMPLAVGRRITEFLGGRKRTHKQKNKRLKRRSRKHRRPLRH